MSKPVRQLLESHDSRLYELRRLLGLAYNSFIGENLRNVRYDNALRYLRTFKSATQRLIMFSLGYHLSITYQREFFNRVNCRDPQDCDEWRWHNDGYREASKSREIMGRVDAFKSYNRDIRNKHDHLTYVVNAVLSLSSESNGGLQFGIHESSNELSVNRRGTHYLLSINRDSIPKLHRYLMRRTDVCKVVQDAIDHSFNASYQLSDEYYRWDKSKGIRKGLRSAESLIEEYCAVLQSMVESSGVEHCYEVSGDDIVAKYDDAFGGSSCMTGFASEYVQIYADNPDRVSLLCYDDGSSTSRALLWTTDSGVRVLDRRFGGGRKRDIAFNTYCEEHNVLSSADGLSCDDSKITMRYFCGVVPYLDTFCFATEKYRDGRNYLILSNRASNGCLTLQTQDGTLYGDSIRCECCGDMIHEDDSCYHESLGTCCTTCYSNNTFSCESCYETCDTDDEYCAEDGHSYCELCYLDNFTHCEQCDCEIPTDDFRELPNNNCETVCEDCYDSMTALCGACDDHVMSDMMMSLDGHPWYGAVCDDCHADALEDCVTDDDDDSSDDCESGEPTERVDVPVLSEVCV